MSKLAASPVTRPRAPATTWRGLFLSLFGMLIIRDSFRLLHFDASSASAVAVRELIFYAFAIALLLFVRFAEKRTLQSVGIGTSKALKTLAWGCVTAAVCLLVGGAVGFLTHFNGGQPGRSMARLPVWLLVVIVFRAGIVVELCYRGYSIERFQELGLSKFWAAAIPLVVFAGGHWTGGWPQIAIAFALGAILSAFYLWRRDLLANIFAHALVDFIGVILPRLVG